MINKVILIGNVGRDPEVRMTQNGKPVAKFSLATTETFNGEKKTEWHNIVLWGKLAEVAEKYMRKGKLVYIEGRITTRSWDGTDGKKQYMTEIVGDRMQMLDRNPEGAGRAQADANNKNDDVPW